MTTWLMQQEKHLVLIFLQLTEIMVLMAIKTQLSSTIV